MKKVLIVTYYWPPSGGPGVQRVLKFAKYLRHFNWEPVILTVRNGEYPNVDESLLKEERMEKFHVIRTPSIEPFSIYKKVSGQGSIPTFQLNKSEKISVTQKIASWVRMNLFIPDARIGWIPFNRRNIVKTIRELNVDIIFTSGPPHSLHFIGKYLKKKTGLPWVADFRDPWTDLFYYNDHNRNIISRYLDKYLENKVFHAASAIVTVSESIRSIFSQIVDRNKIHVLPNGFDEEDFTNYSDHPVKNTILHCGTLSKHQIPVSLFNALVRIKQIGSEKQTFKLKFIGDVHREIIKSIKQLKLDDITEFHPVKDHSLIINDLGKAEYLLVVIPDTLGNKGILTGKLFEYLRAGRKILLIGPEDGDAAKIINDNSAGFVIGYNDRDKIIQILTEGSDLPCNDISRYSRKNLAEKLSVIFKSLIKA